MLDGILSAAQVEVLKEERRLLADVGTELAVQAVPEEERAPLALSVEQLDDLFLVVVVGEFNAGKSSLLNALIGDVVLDEGVTPTTSQIHVIKWGDVPTREVVGDGLERIQLPVSLLREVTLVDTPGTNALERRHEVLTGEFVPRSDLVLFVTSADRPISESERLFLNQVREWGKKVIVVVNKVDILRGEDAVGEVLAYIREHGEAILGFPPKVFPVSALRAEEAHSLGNAEDLVASGLPALEAYLRDVLDRGERVRLKMENPVGVAENLVQRRLDEVGDHRRLLTDDVAALADIERQLEVYSTDVRREFDLRLADIDGVLKALELRGMTFFDDTLRLGRLPQLFDRKALQEQFEEQVVADAPSDIEKKVESLIDWLVGSDLNQWQSVVQHVNKRRSAHADRLVGEVGSRFDYDRAGLLDTVGRSARESLGSYDQAAEARAMAESVQKAVAGTAIVEAGAVGIGATVAMLATTTAADVTGLAAAGLLAAIGLFILPTRRRRAKTELREKVALLRSTVMQGLNEQFEAEAQRGVARIRETIAPYSRFVRSETEHLEGQQSRLNGLADRLTLLRGRIAEVTADEPG